MYQKATHLALDFDQESEAAKNTHTYCIAQGYVSSHLPRDQLKSETGKEAPSRTSSKDSANPRLTSRQNVRTSARCELMMGTSDSSNSSRASMASQAFACQTEKSQAYLLYSSLVDQAEHSCNSHSFQQSSHPNVLTSSIGIRVCTATMSLGTNIRARGWRTQDEMNHRKHDTASSPAPETVRFLKVWT